MAFTRAPISAVITDANGNTFNLGNASGSFSAAPISIVLTDAAGNTLTVGSGTIAKADATAQAANIAATALYTVPVGSGGMYRFSAYAVITQAATTSSVLPQVGVEWTDSDTGVDTGTGNGAFATALDSTNIVGRHGQGWGASGNLGTVVINVQAGSVIKYLTSGYSSTGATPLQYAVHVKLEYLGA